MHRILAAALAVVAISLPTPAWSQDAQSIMQRAEELMMERRAGVSSYLVDQSTMGNRVLQLFERTEVTGPDGSTYETFRLVPITEVEARRAGDSQTLTPSELELFAESAELTGGALASGIEDGLAEAGLPPSLLSATGSDSTQTMDPAVMMGDYAAFLRAAADAEGQAGDGREEASQSVSDMARFARMARLIGTETVDGRDAFHLQADGLDRTQEVDGEEFTVETLSLWIDTEEYVPLRLKMDGVATSGGESRPFSIERIDSDYRSVPGSNMYESYRQTLRIGGVLDESQQAELREAQEQIAELERQMESMPPQQRAMMERMMGSQLDMIRRMAAGGGFEVETVVQEIRTFSDSGL